MKKLPLFALALVLVGAGCLGADTAPETSTPSQNDGLTQQVPAPGFEDSVDEMIVQDDGDVEEAPEEVRPFQMVEDPKPPTEFQPHEAQDAHVISSQVLKLDLDGDGSLEYALILTDPNMPAQTIEERLIVYKWNGAEWTRIFVDEFTREDANGVTLGWFNRYEVRSSGDGKHLLHIEKTFTQQDNEEYDFGQLPDGSFGKL